MADERVIYTTGSAVLFEGDVRRSWLTRIDQDGRGWTPGPLIFAGRRDAQSTIGPDERARRLGASIAHHTQGIGRRYHRPICCRVSTTARDGETRTLTVVALELIVADRDAEWVPAVAVVHVDPPGKVSSDPEASSATRLQHVDNLLARFFKFGTSTNVRLIEEMLVCPDPPRDISYGATSFGWQGENTAEAPGHRSTTPAATDALPVRLLANPTHGVPASFPSYWLFTDVAPDEDGDVERWGDDITYYEKGGGRPLPLEKCEAVERRRRRSRVLSELQVRPWALAATERAPDGGQGDNVLSWTHWDTTFGRSGAGFAHSLPEGGSYPTLHRREDLSTVYVDLIALEMLRDRIIQGFSERTRELAADTRRNADRREQCVDAWKDLVTFTSEHFGRASGLELRDRDFLAAFRTGSGLDLEEDLVRAQANLERLAEISRMELDEERSTRAHAQTQAEGRFNRVLGVLATIVIPLTVVPPLLEWFVPLPSGTARIAGTLSVFALGVLLALALWWLTRRSDRHSA